MIQFGEWLPDQPDYSNPGVTEATNVIPAASGYRSMPSFVEYSNAASSTILNIFAAKQNDGSVRLFAGDSGKLYLFNAVTSNLDDISKAGTPAYDLASAERWKFVQFGNDVIASGGIGEELQKFTLGTDSAFSDLSGTPPKGDFLAVVRDFVWVANVDTGSGRVPYKAYWSGFNDPTSWTAGVDQSDFQDIPDAGAITGMVGGEYCTILMERAIVRATYTGPPLIWQFDKVETARGCQVPGSVCNVGHTVFYLSDDGFYVFDGSKSQPIGAEKINSFFLNDFNAAFKDKMTSTVDPQEQIAVWSYVSNSAIDETPDRLLIYNYALNRWSLANVKSDLVAPFFTAGYTLENLDNINSSLDALPASLDSPLYKGGQYLFGGALGAKISAFTGDPMAATIVTGETGLAMGNHNIVTRIYPYHEGGSVEVSVGLRGTHTDLVSYTAAGTTNAAGFVPFRAQDRYHRAKMYISGNWTFAQGMDIDARKVGRR
jgi:hypothetical protein